MSTTTINTLTLTELFESHKYEQHFIIPDYQRPYKWNTKNMYELLSDIESAIDKSDSPDIKEFKYRLGTIILNGNEIVDGQQRIISLLILRKYIAECYEDKQFSVEDYIGKAQNDDLTDISIYNIQQNYTFVRDYLNSKSKSSTDTPEAKEKQIDLKAKILNAFDSTLEVIVIKVEEISEAFQLFDSQNSRGKALYPHDLLKAYHLREMNDFGLEKYRVVTDWESNDAKRIFDLFSTYLFRILKWSKGENYQAFTANDIDFYKGINEKSGYNYAQYIKKAMPYFLINEPFICGRSFFEMVQHYLTLLEDIKNYLKTEGELENINKALEEEETEGTGYQHVCNLFYATVLFYYDRFQNLDPLAIQKLFSWSFQLRIHRKKLGLDSINKHALGESGIFKENIQMFKLIATARLHTEISGLSVAVESEGDNTKYANIIKFKV